MLFVEWKTPLPRTGVDFQLRMERVAMISVMAFLKKVLGTRQCVGGIILEKRNWEKLRFCHVICLLFVFAVVG